MTSRTDTILHPIILETISVYTAFRQGDENYFVIETEFDYTEAVKKVHNPMKFGQILEKVVICLNWEEDPNHTKAIEEGITFYSWTERELRSDHITCIFAEAQQVQALLTYKKPVAICYPRQFYCPGNKREIVTNLFNPDYIAKESLEEIPSITFESLIRFKPVFYHKVWVIGQIYDISVNPTTNDMKLYLIRYLIKVFTYKGQAMIGSTWNLFNYEQE